MALERQCHIYSIGTDALYTPDERRLHQRMAKLHKLKNKDIPKWKKSSVNRLLRKHKERINELLNEKVNTGLVRELPEGVVGDRNVISLFESSLTRFIGIKSNELSEKLFQVEFYFYQVMSDLIHNGFNYKGKHYVYFSSSAGSIRKHRGLFIEEETLKEIWPRLTCGLTVEDINKKGGCVINKWLAYLALSSSATEVWEDFNIDKAIVCDDFEIDVFGDMDYIDDKDYSITRKHTSVAIPMNDGVSIMLPKCGPTRVIRAPFVKGLSVCFPFDEFIKEKCGGECVVRDIYGKEHKIIEEKIEYILTKSQFKMH